MLNVACRMLDAVGYEVEQKTTALGSIYQGLPTGDVDVFSSAFLPGQQSHINKHEGMLDYLGTSYAAVPPGLMAPAYVPVNTHDLDEAIRLGERIAIMKDGRLSQIGTPEEIITNPADDYVAEFLKGIARLELIYARTIGCGYGHRVGKLIASSCLPVDLVTRGTAMEVEAPGTRVRCRVSAMPLHRCVPGEVKNGRRFGTG